MFLDKLNSINFKKSRELYEYFKKDLKYRQCFYNTGYIAMNIYNNRDDWSVVFGCYNVPGINRLYAFHCFLLYKEDVVDVTPFVNSDSEDAIKSSEYYIIKKYSIEEYLSEVVNTKDNDPALCNVFKKILPNLTQDLYQRNIVLIS